MDDKEKIKRHKELGLYGDLIVKLIKSIGEDEYTKQCIENDEIREKLDLWDVFELINSIGENEHIKELLENREKYGLDDGIFTFALIHKIGDNEYVKSILGNQKLEEFYAPYLKAINGEKEDVKLVIKNIQEVDLDGFYKGKEEVVFADQIRSMYVRLLMVNIGEEDYTKECIEKHEELGLYILDIVELIKSVGKEDYTKDCIERHKDLGLDNEYGVSGTVELIKSVGKEDYTKDCIKRHTDLGLQTSDIVELIKSVRKEDYTKQCIKRHKDLGLDSKNEDEPSGTMDLIKFIGKEDYTKDCIEIHKDLGLNGFDIVVLVKSIGKEDYTKDCIEKHKELVLEKKYVVHLIKYVRKEDYTKQCIKRHKELGLDSEEREWGELSGTVELIEFIGEAEYTKECIEKHGELGLDSKYGLALSGTVRLIESVGKEEYTKDCIKRHEELGLNRNNIVELIKSVGKEDYTKEYIEKHKELWLDSSNIVELIKSIGKEDYTKQCIERHGELGLNSDNIAELIKSIGKEDYTKECIERHKELCLDSYNIVRLIKSVRKEDYTKQCIKRHKELGLEKKDVVQLICNLDKDDILKYITRSEELGISCIEIVDNIPEKLKIEMLIKAGVNKDKYNEFITIKDIDSIKEQVLRDIFIKGINGKNGISLNSYDLDTIVSIFKTNKLPIIFKEYEFFKHHRNYNSKNEYFYGGKSQEERDKIIKNDLFKIALESNNKEVRKFLECLYNGNIVLNRRKENNIELEEAILLEYRDVLYDFIKVIEEKNFEKTDDIYSDINAIKKYLGIQEQDIGEVLLRKYFENIGLNCEENKLIPELLDYMDLKCQSANKENIKEFRIEKGDLIKGTSLLYIPDFIKNGIRSKEFFAVGDLTSDYTPLDSDFSEITDGNLAKTSLKEKIQSTYTSESYGKTWIVIKNNKHDIQEENSRTESSSSTRYIRTGIGSANIGAIITNEWNEEYKYRLAENEFYIPIIDYETEKVLFTYEEYQSIRAKMQGLTHYGIKEFEIDERVSDENILKKAEEIKSRAKGKISTDEIRKKIVELVRKNIGKKLVTEISGNETNDNVEFIDTGSTGRGTNIPGEGDFDFMLKCFDKEEQKRMISTILENISGEDKGGTNEYNIRYKNVEIDGLDEKIELDVTSEEKRLSVDYSTDMSIRERLDTIRRNYGEEIYSEVIDNIIVAKNILKENGIYKKSNSKGATKYGGFGGVGVETWILQNGGSFINAMQTFLESSIDENGHEISFEAFKKKYEIYDFGQNHRELSKKHDHFIEGLTPEGFNKMRMVFRDILKELEKDQNEERKKTFFETILQDTKKELGKYRISDMSQMYGLLSNLRTHSRTIEEGKDNIDKGEVEIDE